MKVIILIFTLLFLNIYSGFAQKSPVNFLNNTCTINVDTSNGSKIVYKHLINLKYKFINTGEHLTFIDSDILPSCITKPKDTSVLVLKFNDFFKEKGVGLGSLFLEDTFSYIDVPFYYEGDIYYEKIICNYTFGKSRLIEYDDPFMLVNDTIAKFFTDDTTTSRKYPSIRFTMYYAVKNITDDPVWCTKKMIGWHDTNIRDENYRNGQNFIIIPPHSTYLMPVEMNMASKYKFVKYGNFIVFSEDIFEVHDFIIKSDFEPEKISE